MRRAARPPRIPRVGGGQRRARGAQIVADQCGHGIGERIRIVIAAHHVGVADQSDIDGRCHHGQPRGEVLVELERAAGVVERVAPVRDDPHVRRAHVGCQLAVRHGPDGVDVRSARDRHGRRADEHDGCLREPTRESSDECSVDPFVPGAGEQHAWSRQGAHPGRCRADVSERLDVAPVRDVHGRHPERPAIGHQRRRHPGDDVGAPDQLGLTAAEPFAVPDADGGPVAVLQPGREAAPAQAPERTESWCERDRVGLVHVEQPRPPVHLGGDEALERHVEARDRPSGRHDRTADEDTVAGRYRPPREHRG